MEKKIVAIRGRPNSGKTSAIKLAQEELAKEGSCTYSNLRCGPNEIQEILVIDGVMVGFASAGDIPDRLRSTLRRLHGHACAVIVCAARLNRLGETDHKTVKVVEQFCDDNGFGLDWIDKPRRDDDHDGANRAVAGEIVARVRAAIGSGELMKT